MKRESTFIFVFCFVFLLWSRVALSCHAIRGVEAAAIALRLRRVHGHVSSLHHSLALVEVGRAVSFSHTLFAPFRGFAGSSP